MDSIDYSELKLKVGLEIHQQLDTKSKLFCSCPTSLVEESGKEFERSLRPTRSETGEVDIAALFEWRKGRKYRYQAPEGHYCMVEADEEPPHEMNREAVAIVVAIALALNSNLVDEVHTMRKIVIDGSNTSGFQRTAIIALNGYINVNGKKHGIETIALEEDAARKVSEEGKRIIYKLDRLGIPLIEIATSPDIASPKEARDVALAIGRLLRLTGRVKRGLGTIRQDLNISIEGGAKTEVKGVQKLDLIEKIVQFEVERQVNLLKIKDELNKRGIRKEELDNIKAQDLTEVFMNTKSKVIKSKINSGKKVVGAKLPGLKGILGIEIMPNRRFGKEIADYVRFWSGVEGFFHSDELPRYGITIEEVEKTYSKLSADRNKDAFVIISDDYEKCLKALRVIIDRIKMAFKGVPEETRSANEDGTTKYMRPRPGKERMYPETDIPPLYIGDAILKEAERIKPESLEVKMRKLIERYGLSRELAEKTINDVNLGFIEELLDKYGDKIQPTLIASIFVNIIRGLKSKGVNIDLLSEKKIEEIIRLLYEKKISKEAIEDLLIEACEKPEYSIEEIVNMMGIGTISVEEARNIVKDIVKNNKDLIVSKGMRSINILMGKAMSRLRGKIDGKIVSELVNDEVKKILNNV